jgi:lipopolysaccharide transport system permease protein
MVLHPLAQVLMYALVLSGLLSSRLPGIEHRYAYAIYLTAGILAWSLFAEIVSRCLTIFIDNGNLLKKVAFPKICLPLIVTGTALVNHVLLLASILLIFSLLGHAPAGTILWVALLAPLTVLLALGAGLVLGTLNVFFRDIGQVVPILLQFGFWFTPIVYTRDAIPETLRVWLVANPVAHLVRGYQQSVAFGETPGVWGLAAVVALAVGLHALALFLLRRAGPELADVL